MTATLTPPRVPTRDAIRRSLTFVASTGGAAAALATLATCLGVGVVGWFLTDGGAHGEPRDGLRAGGTAWLMAHGSGISRGAGCGITAIPLGLTAICAWVAWRFGLRVGEAVAGHGPDAEALAEGQRDVTVPVAAGLFTAAYVIVAVLVGVFSGTAESQPSLQPVVQWSIALAGLVGGAAITVGSGRAAVWLSLAPAAARATAYTTGVMLKEDYPLIASALAFTVALLLDFSTALNVLSRLHTNSGDAVLFALLTLTVVPNAILFAGAYLLGPGFAVGTGTLVSPWPGWSRSARSRCSRSWPRCRTTARLLPGLPTSSSCR